MISDLVGPTRLPTEDGRDRFVVLVDTGRDENGKRGLIIRHPYQDDYKDRPTELPLAYAPELIDKKEGFAGPYTDPVGKEAWGERFAVPWIAAVEPARVPVAPQLNRSPELRDTGWLVVVQEAEAGVVGPIRTLRTRLAWGATLSVSLIALLLGGLWLFVLVVMDAAPGSRVVQYLRRQAGLRTAASGSISASETSGGASGTPRTGSTPQPTA